MMTRFAAKVLSWSTTIAITFAMIEIGLRILPGAIPLGLLKKFEPGTRLEIAQRRGLPNLSQIWVLPRDDNGPELKLFKPFTSHKLRHRDDGTVEAVDLDGNGFCNPLPDGGYAAPKIDILIGYTVLGPPGEVRQGPRRQLGAGHLQRDKAHPGAGHSGVQSQA